ncbi:hypothetical protein GCM10009654_24220 [Streptomyces hebeiensis]|uniref:TadE-like domain-containing protein n=1 Tax=Streptomyces hebeiensis TaxID=229486 RepID=A0ABN1USQ6_9ACTN
MRVQEPAERRGRRGRHGRRERRERYERYEWRERYERYEWRERYERGERPGRRSRPGARPGARPLSRLSARLKDDRGQAVIEFVGTAPLILATCVLLWQAALVGYTFSLAGNAADEAARAGAVADPGNRNAACHEAASDKLPGAWSLGDVRCPEAGDLVEATVPVKIPVLVPGFDLPVGLEGRASATKES